MNGKVDLSYQAIVKILWVIDPDQSVDVFFPRCKVRKRGSSKQNPIPPSEDDKTFPPSEESKLAGLLTAMKYVRKEILREPSSPADSLSRGELADLLNKMKKGKLPESPLLQVVLRSWGYSLLLASGDSALSRKSGAYGSLVYRQTNWTENFPLFNRRV